MLCVEIMALLPFKTSNEYYFSSCHPNLATICLIGITVRSGSNTPSHHHFELDVSEEIKNLP